MKNFLLQKNSQASSQQSRHMWEQTKRSITDGEGGNWPDFQRRLNPRLSESRPSLVGKEGGCPSPGTGLIETFRALSIVRS